MTTRGSAWPSISPSEHATICRTCSNIRSPRTPCGTSHTVAEITSGPMLDHTRPRQSRSEMPCRQPTTRRAIRQAATTSRQPYGRVVVYVKRFFITKGRNCENTKVRMIAKVPAFFCGFALSCFRDGKNGRRKNRPSRSSLQKRRGCWWPAHAAVVWIPVSSDAAFSASLPVLD